MTKEQLIEAVNTIYPNLPSQAVSFVSPSHEAEYKACCERQEAIFRTLMDEARASSESSEFLTELLLTLEESHNEETSLVAEACYILGVYDKEKELLNLK